MARNFFNFPAAAVLVLLSALSMAAQNKVPTAPPGKTILLDANGDRISNNEFADIRLANYNSPDRTVISILPDESVQFRLQPIPQEGMEAPEVTVRTLDGKTISLKDLRGKVVVLNLWFIGCPVCRGMESKLDDLRRKFVENKDVVFLAITADPSRDVKAYRQKHPFSYFQAADGEIAIKKFAFAGYPKNIVISRDGKIVYWRTTISAWEKFESVVKKELLNTTSVL